MSDLPQHFRRLAEAVDKEHYALAQRKDDGEAAIHEFARIGSQLLELGLTVLGEVPELDLKDVEAAVLAVRASLGERLVEPPGLPAESQQTTRVLRVGGLTITVGTERTDNVWPDDDGR